MSSILLILDNSYHITKERLYQFIIRLCTFRDSNLCVIYKQQLFSRIPIIFKDKQLSPIRQYCIDRLFKLLRNRQEIIARYQSTANAVPTESDKKVIQIVKEVQDMLMSIMRASAPDPNLKLYIFQKIEDIHTTSRQRETLPFSHQFYENLISLIYLDEPEISRSAMQTFSQIYQLYCGNFFKNYQVYDLCSRQSILSKDYP